MNRKIQEFVDKNLTPLLKKEQLILVILAGVLLLVISLPTKKKEAAADQTTGAYAGNASGLDGADGREEDFRDEDYRKKLETELTQFLASLEGVGEVRVMIMLRSSEELVVDREKKSDQKCTREEDGSGGTRLATEMSVAETVIYETATQEKEPFVIKKIYPEVEGVVVAAQGVGTGKLRTEISETVQALFGLEAHKVKVVKMGNISSETGIE